MGSSPISRAVLFSLAKVYPLVFRLYPRLSVAILKLSFNLLTRYSTMGDLPVPQVERLPTQIRGRPKEAERIIPLLYIQLRIAIASQYSRANGNKRMRKDLRKKSENIAIMRRNTKI